VALGRKTGGRQKGTPNKATAEKAAEVAASGLSPLDFMLKLMRDEEQPLPLRADAAKNAAPYVHPRLAAVEHTGKVSLPIVISSTDADL
jgi:hypothetical protein